MIIDGHRHIVDEFEPILAEMDCYGIDKTILVGIGVRDLSAVTVTDSFVFRSHFLFRNLGMLKARHWVASPAFQRNLLSSPRNDAVLSSIALRPDRFIGFAFINPESPQAISELQHCLNQGMQGIKLALVQYPSDLRGINMINICEVARSEHVPVFIHLGLTEATAQPDWLVNRFPDVNFIIAHAGVQCFEETLTLAKCHDNVFVDTSSYIATTAKIQRLCETIGSSKLLFGSDIPVMCENLTQSLAKIDRLRISTTEKMQILGGNLQQILEH